jgi:hypothetical protein
MIRMEGVRGTPRERIDTALGRFDLVLSGDIRSVNAALAAVATRLAWTVGAMLLAIGLTWAVIELFVIRRITLLTRRAAAVSLGVRGGGEVGIDLTDLRGGDELAVLARGLNDLLQRVYMAKMGGMVTARNVADGVVFTLVLPRASA